MQLSHLSSTLTMITEEITVLPIFIFFSQFQRHITYNDDSIPPHKKQVCNLFEKTDTIKTI